MALRVSQPFLRRTVNRSNSSTLCGLACTPVEKNLFWDNTGQPRTPPAAPCTNASSIKSLLRGLLLLAMKIIGLAPGSPYPPPAPAHSLGLCSRGERKNIDMNVFMKPYEFGSVSSGVLCYDKRIFDVRGWRAAFIVHIWR